MLKGIMARVSGETQRERLSRIETKLDWMMRLFTEDHEKRIEDHEKRMRGLERWRYAVPPTLLLAIVSIVVAFTRLGLA